MGPGSTWAPYMYLKRNMEQRISLIVEL
jgi:hypothetical protein